MSLKVCDVGNPVLRKVARSLSADEIRSKDIQDLIGYMRDTMRDAPGVGLAASQIGTDSKALHVLAKEQPRRPPFGTIKSVRGEVDLIEPAARHATAGSTVAETYLAAASSLTGIPRAFATPSP
jgi:peptide deformylase